MHFLTQCYNNKYLSYIHQASLLWYLITYSYLQLIGLWLKLKVIFDQKETVKEISLIRVQLQRNLIYLTWMSFMTSDRPTLSHALSKISCHWVRLGQRQWSKHDKIRGNVRNKVPDNYIQLHSDFVNQKKKIQTVLAANIQNMPLLSVVVL